ncbi:MAG: relaxase/mobilization nuclease domain-containing protein [Anaerovoracaceae bacterium]
MSNIVVMNNTYSDEGALETVFYYCLEKCEYWGGFGVRAISPREAIQSMQYIKEYWRKTGGKQLGHIVIGVDTNFDTGREYTRLQTAKDGAYLDDFAVIVSYLIYQEGFQNCFFKHVSKEGRPHVHYVINTVNVSDGKKLSSHSELAYGIHQFLAGKYPDLKWTGVKFNRGLYE